MSTVDVETLVATARGMFGDCDCRVVGDDEAEAYGDDMAAAETALESLASLARLSIELGEKIDAADHRKHVFQYGGQARAWRELRKTRAKITEVVT